MRLRGRHLLLTVVVLAAAGCGATASTIDVPGGDASRGKQLVDAYGCGACHTIAGIHGADGEIGPSLEDFADRRYIAGRLAEHA